MNKKLKSKKVNTNKGITLIALIITIIVLLILAAVTIRAITGGNGILSYAKNARDKWEEEAANEEAMLGNLTNYITEQTGNNPAGGGEEGNPSSTLEIELKVDEEKVTGDTIPVSVAKITANGSEEKTVDDNFQYEWYYEENSKSTDGSKHTFNNLSQDESYTLKCKVSDDAENWGIGEVTVIWFKVEETYFRATSGMTWGAWCTSKYSKSMAKSESCLKKFDILYFKYDPPENWSAETFSLGLFRLVLRLRT